MVKAKAQKGENKRSRGIPTEEIGPLILNTCIVIQMAVLSAVSLYLLLAS
jgi:hypothetical protein